MNKFFSKFCYWLIKTKKEKDEIEYESNCLVGTSCELHRTVKKRG